MPISVSAGLAAGTAGLSSVATGEVVADGDEVVTGSGAGFGDTGCSAGFGDGTFRGFAGALTVRVFGDFESIRLLPPDATFAAAAAAAPDLCEAEACFDRVDSLRMEISTRRKWTTATLAAFRGWFAVDGRADSRPRKATGKANAQPASASAPAAIMLARRARCHQAPPGPIAAILCRERSRAYPSAGGDATL